MRCSGIRGFLVSYALTTELEYESEYASVAERRSISNFGPTYWILDWDVARLVWWRQGAQRREI